MKYTYLIAAVILMVSCKKATSLESLKADLATKKAAFATAKTEIESLEKQIAKLSPVKEEAALQVTLMPVAASVFNHYVDLQGSLDTKDVVYATPQTPGTIEKVFVKEGDYVKAGQIIARIDNSILATSINEVQVQLNTAKTFLAKQQSLWDQKIGTEVQLIQAKTQVEALESRISTIKEQLKLGVAIAPISGQVDEVRQKAGEMGSPGMPICKIVNTSNLKAKANVPDSYASSIKKGDRVTIELPDLGQTLQSNISFVSSSVNPMSRTIEIHAQLPKQNGSMKPNMTAKIKVLDQSKPNSIVVPQNLIQTTEDGEVIYIAVTEGNKKIAKSKLIKTGPSYNGNIVIESGLSAGDQLIFEGAQDVVDGQLISVK